MKLVFLTSRSLSKIGGIENYMSNLCPGLAKKGHDVVLYTEGDQFKEYEYEGIKVISFTGVSNKFLNKIQVGWKASRHALKYHKDADLYHYNAMAAGLSSWLPVIRKKNVLFQGHGFEWQRAKWSNSSRKLIKILDSFCLRVNKNITMVSQDQSDYVQEKYGKNSATITPGINLPSLVVNSEINLEEFGISENDRYVLYLGRLVPEKKADVLISAFIQANLNKDIKLVIAGDDPNEKKYIKSLKGLAKEKSDQIIFTGAVYGEKKEHLLAGCNSFCIPSELEGLPITLLEAMSYRKVCIASDIPANKEALADSGLFFSCNNDRELANVLEDVVKSGDPYIHLGDKAYIRARDNFTWEKIIEQYEAICKEISRN